MILYYLGEPNKIIGLRSYTVGQISTFRPLIFSKCFLLPVTKTALLDIAVAAISASTSPVGLPILRSLLFIVLKILEHSRSNGTTRTISTNLCNFSTCAVRFLTLVVGWVERQKNGGFRCFNLILHTSHNIHLCVISETHRL